MVKFLDSLIKKVALNKWQALGGKMEKPLTVKPGSKPMQDFIKILANKKMEDDENALEKYVLKSSEGCLVASGESGCFIASILNALRLPYDPMFQDAHGELLSFQWISDYCNTRGICQLENISLINVTAVTYLLRRSQARNFTAEPELYVLFDWFDSSHAISVDLKLGVIYDSCSKYGHPYELCEDAFTLLKFSAADKTLELRKLTNIGLQFRIKVTEEILTKRKRKLLSISTAVIHIMF